MSINRVCISGNLTRDPETRATASGLGILTFSVAVNDRAKNQQTGEWEDRPNYIDCKVLGRRADALAGRLRKGAKVCVAGRLRHESWEAKDGSKRSKLTVTADEVELMGGQQEAKEMIRQTFGAQADVYADEDVPF